MRKLESWSQIRVVTMIGNGVVTHDRGEHLVIVFKKLPRVSNEQLIQFSVASDHDRIMLDLTLLSKDRLAKYLKIAKLLVLAKTNRTSIEK